jgi:hypothetical protein
MFRMSSVVKISGVARPSHWIDTQFFVVPTTVPASSLVFTRSPSTKWFACALVIGTLLPTCARQLFFNHLRQLVVAIVQLQNFDQLSVR